MEHEGEESQPSLASDCNFLHKNLMIDLLFTHEAATLVYRRPHKTTFVDVVGIIYKIYAINIISMDHRCKLGYHCWDFDDSTGIGKCIRPGCMAQIDTKFREANS